MFTGIITDVGRVKAVEPGRDAKDTRFVLGTKYDTDSLDIGASVACSGACLTVVEKGSDWFAVEASAETLAMTTLGDWADGTPINLERALAVGTEMGGHIVTGHVDGVAEVRSTEPEGGSMRFRIEAPSALRRYIAPKGSVALDGVSLTVNEVENGTFGVNIIGHTQSCTTFGNLAAGNRLNLEVDLVARYVARLMEGD